MTITGASSNWVGFHYFNAYGPVEGDEAPVFSGYNEGDRFWHEVEAMVQADVIQGFP